MGTAQQLNRNQRHVSPSQTPLATPVAQIVVVSFYSYKKPENEKLPYTWERMRSVCEARQPQRSYLLDVLSSSNSVAPVLLGHIPH